MIAAHRTRRHALPVRPRPVDGQRMPRDAHEEGAAAWGLHTPTAYAAKLQAVPHGQGPPSGNGLTWAHARRRPCSAAPMLAHARAWLEGGTRWAQEQDALQPTRQAGCMAVRPDADVEQVLDDWELAFQFIPPTGQLRLCRWLCAYAQSYTVHHAACAAHTSGILIMRHVSPSSPPYSCRMSLRARVRARMCAVSRTLWLAHCVLTLVVDVSG